MKFLLFILIIIDNLNVLLANNDNCRENDLNALMVRLRVLRTDFADLKIKHDELINRIDLINNTQADLKEANANQETELKKLKQEINSTSSEINTENRKQDTELTKLRQEIDAIKEDFADLKTKHDELINRINSINATQAVLKKANDNQETELKRLKQEINSASSGINTENRKQDTELTKLRQEIDALKEVRLVDGLSQYEGRLEVWHDNTWGTVCDDRFETQDAKVACKMLNYPDTSPVVHRGAHFGLGTGPIFLDEVQCTGSETSLFQCPHRGWRIHNCVHSEDVGISCK